MCECVTSATVAADVGKLLHSEKEGTVRPLVGDPKKKAFRHYMLSSLGKGRSLQGKKCWLWKERGKEHSNVCERDLTQQKGPSTWNRVRERSCGEAESVSVEHPLAAVSPSNFHSLSVRAHIRTHIHACS